MSRGKLSDFATHMTIESELILNVRKHTFWHVRQTKTQISLRIPAVWLESSFSAWRNFAFLAIQSASSEDSDQTAQMRKLIWIFHHENMPI